MPRTRQLVRDRSPQQNGDPLVGSQDRRSLVGWGIGEDELRVQSSGSFSGLGDFFIWALEVVTLSVGPWLPCSSWSLLPGRGVMILLHNPMRRR